MDIGVVIKKYRKEAGMTQEEMANRLGVTTPAVNKWENSNSKPDIELLAPIARLLDISLDTLLSFHEKLSDTEIEEIMIKGFTIDGERLKGNGGGNYWKELLDRIRDIRSSEKVMYRQVLDLYATSVDYNSHIVKREIIIIISSALLKRRAYGNKYCSGTSIFHIRQRI